MYDVYSALIGTIFAYAFSNPEGTPRLILSSHRSAVSPNLILLVVKAAGTVILGLIEKKDDVVERITK